jgi:hypothetical protein
MQSDKETLPTGDAQQTPVAETEQDTGTQPSPEGIS